MSNEPTGNPKAAVNLLVDALASDPSDVEALLALGHALLDDGRVPDALHAF
ncbi:MAG: tetratricopeptide repeat protein, partial [Acidobacteriota bacterium]